MNSPVVTITLLLALSSSSFGVEFTLRLVADIAPVGGSGPGHFTEVDGSLFFFARGGLYSTDGTSVSLVTDDAIGCSIQHKGDFYYGGQGEDNIDRLYSI